jgi:hypothetical protein
MPSPYSSPEISQTGDPNLGQAGVSNPNVNENLYAASYSNAPGRPADASMPGNGSDLASQGLAKLQQGDQYGGIMTLLDAAQQNPQSVQSTAFLQHLQIVESQPNAAQGAQTDSSQFTAPTDSPAYGTTGDANALSSPAAAGAQTDSSSLAIQALQVAQQNPTEGILGLMQASAQNPNLLNDQNFLTTMSEVLPQGSAAAQAQPASDGSQLQQSQLQQPADGSQIQQSQVQQPTDGPQTQQAQIQQPTDGSQTQQAQAQQPSDGSQTQQAQIQQPTDGSQTQQAQVQQPSDGSQTQQAQVQQPTDGSQTQQAQVQQPTDGSQTQQAQIQQPGSLDGSQYQTQPTNDSQYVQQPAAAPTYSMPAQLTSTGDPNIEAGVRQAFQLIQAGDQFDGAKLLMMIAKADPAILQDQAFVKNFTDLENAVKSGTANATTDQTAASQSGAVDANGNPIQQQMVDANGNPIAQPGAQQMVDANGNPIAQPGAQQMVDANGNPIAQPGAQQMVDANGNPVTTDAQGMPVQTSIQGMTGMTTQTAPTDTSTQVASNSDPSVGAPAN